MSIRSAPATGLLVVHGAWHTPAHFAHFTKILPHRLLVRQPHLPSCSSAASSSGLQDDATLIVDELHKLFAEVDNVIVFAHSYGGAVVTQALYDLSITSTGLFHKIKHVIFVAAYLLQPGESCSAVSQPRPDPEPVAPNGDGTSSLSQSGRVLFYHDVKDEQLIEFCEKSLVHHNLAALSTPPDLDSWERLVSAGRNGSQTMGLTYIECLDDRILFPLWQRRMIESMQARRVDLEVRTFEATSHSPFLSQANRLSDIVDELAKRYEGSAVE